MDVGMTIFLSMLAVHVSKISPCMRVHTWTDPPYLLGRRRKKVTSITFSWWRYNYCSLIHLKYPFLRIIFVNKIVQLIIHGQEAFYKHFELRKTTLSPILHYKCHHWTDIAWSIDNFLQNSDLSNMAELPSFSPPASESTLQYRTSPLRQARMRPKLKAAPVYISSQLRLSVFSYISFM